MCSFRFIHAADIHLDSPLRGLNRYEGAPLDEIRSATRRALVGLVDLAIQLSVDFIIIAGDLYDGDWRDYSTGLFFVRQMGRLLKKGIPVYLIAGNHDAESVLTSTLTLPENVRRFSSERAETLSIDGLRVALHGQSFKRRQVVDNLSVSYPPRVEGSFNIGVLHTSLNGREGHETYAPCKVSDLASRGYDYWALGHVHQREVISEEPWIVFSGNVQGRHIREQGPKGCTLVTVVEGEVESVESRALDVLRWAEVSVSCDGASSFNEVMDRVAEALADAVEASEDRILAARVYLIGACAVHAEMNQKREHVTAEIQAVVLSRFADAVWIEKVVLKTTGASNWTHDPPKGTPAAELLRRIDQVSANDEAIASLLEKFADLQRRLPVELGVGEEGGVLSPAWLRERLGEVKEEVVPQLLDDTHER